MGRRDLSPEEAQERFLSRRKQRQSEATVRTYTHRLDHFVEWCDAEGIESMAEIGGWEIDEYRYHRESEDISPTTVKGAMSSLKQLLEFCEKIEVIDEGTADRVEIPKLTKDEETNDEQLHADRATELLRFYRNSVKWEGHVRHAFLEVTWHTGCRMGGLRALDLDDYDADRGALHFQHRPDSGTGLKNKAEGERIVSINDYVVDALDLYIARERPHKRDEFGREPLFATRQGRASGASIRSWSYLGTQPCLHQECPHGRQRHSCEWTERNHASKCPSSRPPHAIRTGSITWQLNATNGDIEYVARRVNANPNTIRRYYDKATPEEEFEERQQKYQNDLVIDNE